MAPTTTQMFAEAAEAPEMAARQGACLQHQIADLAAGLRLRDPALVLTCARGSSDHAASYGKYLIETRLGIPVASHAPSVSSVFHQPLRGLDRALFLTISQSGQSPDLVLSADAARRGGAQVLALVNDTASPLANAATDVVDLCAGPEVSVAATKSCLAALMLQARLVAAWAADADLAAALARAPDDLAQAWALDWSAAIERLVPAANFLVISRGLGLGIAQEAALKFKETCGLHAESISAAEVRHGPMAIVTHGAPVLMFVPADETANGFAELAAAFVARGAHVMVAGASLPGTLTLPTLDAPHATLAPVLQLQSFYRLVNAVAVARGYDPDRPLHLHKVTRTQ